MFSSLVVMTESLGPKKSKGDLERLVKENGGKIYQTNTATPNTICIADRSKLLLSSLSNSIVRLSHADTLQGTVKVASVQKSAKENVVRPSWLFDCIKQNEDDVGYPEMLLPFEPR